MKLIISRELETDLTKLLKSVGLKAGDCCYVAGNVSALAKTKVKRNILLPTCLSAFQRPPSGC